MNCYLLAGGRSRRMGRSKAELFADRILEIARAAFDDVIAVRRAGDQPLAGVTTIFERAHHDQAAIFGVERALEHADQRCFVLAIDYPLISAALLRELASRSRSSTAPLIVPMWGGKPQMLCAGYSSTLLAAIRQRILAGILDLRGLLDETAAEIIPEDELRTRHSGEPLMNVNTPEELSIANERILTSR